MAIGDGRVVSNFIVQALRNEDITIYGDGSQTRSFCYVDDLVEGIIAVMNMKERHSTPINLGNPNDFTMLQLAEIVLELTASKSKLIFCDLPSDDPKQRKPDISLALEKLNWNPKISLVQGIEDTVTYFKSKV